MGVYSKIKRLFTARTNQADKPSAVSVPYNPKTYRLLSKEDIILYKPNSVSRRKHILIGGPAPWESLEPSKNAKESL